MLPAMRHASLFAVPLLLAAVAPAAAEPASDWVREGASELRLVDAGSAPGAGRLAGIAIRLQPGWKTYWRQPGDSGVPPQFDFSGSTNVADVAVAYPAPERQSDETGVTNVYHGEVVLPVTVRPKDPSRPVTLTLVADYGVCEAVCVPAHAETALELGVDGGFQGPAGAAVRRSEAALPKATPIGAANGGLSIAEVVRRATAGGGSEVEVTAAAPAGSVQLFAETGSGDFVRAPEPLGGAEDGRARFRIAFERALPASGLRLTLAAGGRAIESFAPLDAIVAAP